LTQQGERGVDVAHTEVALAGALQIQGDVAGAEELVRHALATYHMLYGEQHWRSAAAQARLAEALKARQDFVAAEELLCEATAGFRAAGQLQNLAGALLAHAELLQMQERSEEAGQLCTEALAMPNLESLVGGEVVERIQALLAETRRTAAGAKNSGLNR
jgi:hypothetical protein